MTTFVIANTGATLSDATLGPDTIASLRLFEDTYASDGTAVSVFNFAATNIYVFVDTEATLISREFLEIVAKQQFPDVTPISQVVIAVRQSRLNQTTTAMQNRDYLPGGGGGYNALSPQPLPIEGPRLKGTNVMSLVTTTHGQTAISTLNLCCMSENIRELANRGCDRLEEIVLTDAFGPLITNPNLKAQASLARLDPYVPPSPTMKAVQDPTQEDSEEVVPSVGGRPTAVGVVQDRLPDEFLI